MVKFHHKPHQKKSSLFEGKAELKNKYEKQFIVFSYLDFDNTQGQSFDDWQDCKLLSLKIQRLLEYSKLTIPEAGSSKFKKYKNFPPPDKTDFKCPSHIIPDAQWYSMHIQGEECIIGHVIKNVFYVVFLDKEHRFWISKGADN